MSDLKRWKRDVVFPTIFADDKDIGLTGWLTGQRPKATQERKKNDYRIVQELVEVKSSLRAHHENLIHRMELWNYEPLNNNEPIAGPSMRGAIGSDYETVDANLTKDKMHLKEFPEVWEIYSNARTLCDNYLAANDAAEAIIKSHLLKHLSGNSLILGQTKNESMRLFTEEIIQGISAELNSNGRLVHRFRTAPITSSTHATVNGFVIEGSSAQAQEFAQHLWEIKQSPEIRDRVGQRRKAWMLLLENREAFIKNLRNKVIEPAKNSDYTLPNLVKGVCDDCKHLKEKLMILES